MLSAIKERSAIFITIFIIFFILAPSFVSAEEKGNNKVEKPNIVAGAGIMYCENTGKTLYSYNANRQYDPYSITKLMTALLAVQNLPLDKEITISEKAASYGESTMELKPGEKVTVEELLYGALILSGNDAAYALGEAVSGDMEKFVKLMNKTAKNIGCKDTNFENPNGIKADKHYTTAEDFLKITRVALSNYTIKKIAGTKKYNMRPTNKSDERKMETHMPLLTDPKSGVYAGKTGLWQTDDCTVALGFEENGLNLFIVLLHDQEEERTKDIQKLIQYAKDSLNGVKVIDAHKKVGKVRINHGAVTKLEAYTKEKGYAYLPKEGTKELIKTKVSMKTDVKAPVKKGETVGYLKIYAGNEIVNRVPLVVHESVETGWLPSYIGISNKMTMIILGILLILILIWIWLMTLRYKAKRKRRLRRQELIRRKAEEALRKEAENKRGRLY